MRGTIPPLGRTSLAAILLAFAVGLGALPLAAHAAGGWRLAMHVGSASGFTYRERDDASSFTHREQFGPTGRLRIAASRRLAHGFSIQAETGWLPYHHAISIFSVAPAFEYPSAGGSASGALDVSFVPMAAGLRYTHDRGGFGGVYVEALPAAFWSRWRVHELPTAGPASFSVLVPGALLGFGVIGGVDRPAAFELGIQWLVTGSSGWRSLGSFGSEDFRGLNSVGASLGLAVRI